MSMLRSDDGSFHTDTELCNARNGMYAAENRRWLIHITMRLAIRTLLEQTYPLFRPEIEIEAISIRYNNYVNRSSNYYN